MISRGAVLELPFQISCQKKPQSGTSSTHHLFSSHLQRTTIKAPNTWKITIYPRTLFQEEHSRPQKRNQPHLQAEAWSFYPSIHTACSPAQETVYMLLGIAHPAKTFRLTITNLRKGTRLSLWMCSIVSRRVTQFEERDFLCYLYSIPIWTSNPIITATATVIT